MKNTAIFIMLFLASALANGQKIDFSGKWTLDNSKSKLNDEFTFAPKEIIIEQKDNDLRVERHSSFQGEEFTINDKFTLDGKECTNPGWQDTEKKSNAVWSPDKSSLKISSKIIMGDGGELTIVEIFRMEDGNLVIDSSASSSYGDVAETMVFGKV